MNSYRNIDSKLIEKKAKELEISDPANISENQIHLFENYPEAHKVLVIKLFVSKVENAPLDQIVQLLKVHNDEFKKVRVELASVEEARKLITKIKLGSCSISDEGKIKCKSPAWNQRIGSADWLGWNVFKPTKPYGSYFSTLTAREPELRRQYENIAILDFFINGFTHSDLRPGMPYRIVLQ